MKNINITKKIMALLSATTIVLTSSSCFEKEKKEENKSSSETITSSISSSISQEELVSSSIAQIEIIDSNISSTESELDISSENNISSTTSKNNSTSNISSKTSNSSKNNTTSKKPESTSSKASTSSRESTSSDISNITQLTKDNINDPEIFLHLAGNFSQDLSTATLMFYTYEYNGEEYATTGKKEFALLMTMMNYQYMEESTIREVFKDCTLEELQRYAYLIKDITFVEEYEKAIFHFEKYSINKEISSLQYKYHDFLLNGNGTIRNLYKEYFKEETSPYCKGETNDGLDYLFFYVARKKCVNLNIEARIEVEEKDEEMKQKYDDFVLSIYNKVNNKEKIYQLIN